MICQSNWKLAQDVTRWQPGTFTCTQHSWREEVLLGNKAGSAVSISKSFFKGFYRIIINHPTFTWISRALKIVVKYYHQCTLEGKKTCKCFPSNGGFPKSVFAESGYTAVSKVIPVCWNNKPHFSALAQPASSALLQHAEQGETSETGSAFWCEAIEEPLKKQGRDHSERTRQRWGNAVKAPNGAAKPSQRTTRDRQVSTCQHPGGKGSTRTAVEEQLFLSHLLF